MKRAKLRGILCSVLLFEFSSWIEAPVEAVFAFHERPDALELLTPPWPPVKVIRRPESLAAGTIVELRVGPWPLSMKWVAHHLAYRPNRMFMDEQRQGPFAAWVHTHLFTPERGGTRLLDSVEFALPGGRIAETLCGWLVRRQLTAMFTYRHAATKRHVRT